MPPGPFTCSTWVLQPTTPPCTSLCVPRVLLTRPSSHPLDPTTAPRYVFRPFFQTPVPSETCSGHSTRPQPLRHSTPPSIPVSVSRPLLVDPSHTTLPKDWRKDIVSLIIYLTIYHLCTHLPTYLLVCLPAYYLPTSLSNLLIYLIYLLSTIYDLPVYLLIYLY